MPGVCKCRLDRNTSVNDEMSAASVPVQFRQQVDRWAEAWLKAKFSRLLELRAQHPGPFDYPIEVFS